MANCFVYGTLMAEEVLKCLIKRVPEQRPGKGAPIEGRRKEESAQLDAPQCPHSPLSTLPSTPTARITGFRRHALKKQVFPATVPATEKDSVVGKV